MFVQIPKAKVIFFIAVLAAPFVFGTHASAEKPKALKDKYHVVQVDLFTTPDDMQFPAKYLDALQVEIIKQMTESHRFTEVLRAGNRRRQEDGPVLQITGTVTRFKPGSRAERYVIGFGAGKTEVFGHLVFKDNVSNEVVGTADIRGKMQAGFFGGESIAVTHDFAHRVGETTKMLLEKKVTEARSLSATGVAALEPAPAEPTASSSLAPAVQPASDTSAILTTAATPSSQMLQHHVEFSSGNFEVTQKKLAAEGATGYRIVNFAVTGAQTADVVFEKASGSAVTYEYVVLHGRTEGGLNHRINEQADKGYRLVPNNLALFGGVFACIMEKPSTPRANTYKYKLHASFRVSSAQRNIEREQADGYVLAGSATMQYMHLVLLEKEMPATVPATK